MDDNKESLFSEFEILEMKQQIKRKTRQQDPNTVFKTLNTEKPEHLTSESKHRTPKKNGTNTKRRRNNECNDYKDNHIWEDHITISQEPRLENNQGRNKKNTKNKLLTIISTN